MAATGRQCLNKYTFIKTNLSEREHQNWPFGIRDSQKADFQQEKILLGRKSWSR